MNIKFKKFGLSPDDIQQMKNYKLNSIIDIYSDFQQYGLPIANTPSGDSIILSSDGKIHFFNHNIDSIDEESGVIAENFLELLEKLY